MSEILVLPILNRLDAAIKKLTEILDKLLGKPAEEGLPTIVVIKPEYNNRYQVFSINTGVVHTDDSLGLKDILTKHGAFYASYMSVLAIGGGFSYKVNSKGNNSLTASIGEEWSEFEIEEIFITNAAVAGTALIYVEWRAD